MKKVIFCVFTIFISAFFAYSVPVGWLIADGGNGHYYETTLIPEGIDWESAQSNAMSKGGYLATIASVEENMFVFSLVSNNPDFWIRLTDSHNPDFIYGEDPWLGGFKSANGSWHWATEEPFVYTNWAPYEPDPYTYNDQLQFFGGKSILFTILEETL